MFMIYRIGYNLGGGEDIYWEVGEVINWEAGEDIYRWGRIYNLTNLLLERHSPLKIYINIYICKHLT